MWRRVRFRFVSFRRNLFVFQFHRFLRFDKNLFQPNVCRDVVDFDMFRRRSQLDSRFPVVVQRLDNVVKIPNRGSRLAKYLRVHPQQFDQIFARHGGGLKRELRAVVINEMHEGHEVIFSDVRQNEKGLVSLQQDIGHERTAGREDCSMHGHVADSVLSEEDVQI